MIYGILAKFNRGEVSKRETISIISDTLGGHIDLKVDLMDILQHQEARWAPGDFDIPLRPRPQLAPHFLQPDHQPQMRLPPISTSWNFSNQALRSFDSVVTSGFEELKSFDKPDEQQIYLPQSERVTWHVPDPAMLSSPVPPVPLSHPIPAQLTPPNFDHMIEFHAYGSLDHDVKMDKSSGVSQCGQKLETWETMDYGNTWRGDRLDLPLSSRQFHLPIVPYQAAHAENGCLERRSESFAALSPYRLPVVLKPASLSDPLVQENPDSMPIGQPTVDISPRIPPPPSRKRGRKPDVSPKKMDKKRKNCGDGQMPEIIPGQPIVADRSKQAPANTANYQGLESTGAFVHSLCGKGFASRAKVKKHHWGNKQNDLDTTTGCWAKHNKPDARWDDHPSCKERSPSSSKLESTEARSVPPDHQAPMVSTMISRHQHALSTIPTLEDLPHAVAAAIKSQHTPFFHVQNRSLQHDLFRDGLLPYHTQSLPPRSPFENLLTAVNVAAKIEAPISQGRNDSAAFHLDAQVVAAERDGQYLPAWGFSPYHRGVDYSQQHMSSPSNDGMSHTLSSLLPPAPRTVAYASQIDGNDYPFSTMSRPVHKPSSRNPFASPGFVENGSAHKDYFWFPWSDQECLRSSASSGTHKV
jgi:hypothetical protein